MPNLADWIDRWAAIRPHHPALVFEERIITYRDFAAAVARHAGALETLGIGRGERVAHLGANTPEMLYLFFACARLGAMFVPLNWRLAAPEHAHQLTDSGASLLAYDPEFAAHAKTIEANVRRADLSRDFHGTPRATGPGDYQDRFLIGYTSGTTGHPKGAVLKQEAFLWNALNSVATFDLTAQDRVLTALPMFHVGGLNIQTVPALHAGATVVLHRRFEPGAYLAAIPRHRITLTLAVPAVARALIDHPTWHGADLSSLRAIGVGSSVVPLPLIEAWHARGVPCAQVYGATETGPVTITLRPEDARAHPESCGKPALHCDARIVDDAFKELPPGGKGEIVCRGGNVMCEYWNDPAATRAAFTQGWFHTGDIGHRDADGFFHVDDRKKDMIISGGENIYPAEIEAVLSACPDIAEAAVIGRADDKWGEVPVAFVIRRNGAAIDERGVLALCDGRLAKFKWPRAVVFADELPRTALGKVQKGALRKRLSPGLGG
jgi:fatty-acyl-CoA synthase